MLLPSASGTKKLESKRKKDARQVLASAPLAEAPGGSAIALTPGSWTKTITSEAESGRKRRRVASRGTSAGDDAEKEPPTRAATREGGKTKQRRRSPLLRKTTPKKAFRFGPCRAVQEPIRPAPIRSQAICAYFLTVLRLQNLAKARGDRIKARETSRAASGEKRENKEQGKPRGTARSPLHPPRPQISKPLASAVSGDSTGPRV